MTPIRWFSRSRKFAIAFFARWITGFCPVIAAISAAAASSSFGFWVASPSPTFRVIFTRRGICMALLYENRFCSSGATDRR